MNMCNMGLRKFTIAVLSLLLTIGLLLAIPLPASAGANWIRVASGTSNALNSVCYGNSKYVAVGDGGVILTSSNLSSWSKPSSGTTTDLLGVSTNGSGRFVAVGKNGTVITSTDNGTNWSATSISGLSNTTGCITYGGGTFMAFFGADCYISPSGASWTKKTSASSNVNGIAYGASKFWAVGNSVAAYSADSGASWSNWNWCYCSASALNALVYNDATYFVSFGNSGKAYETFTSDDTCGDTYYVPTTFTSYNYKGAGYGFIDGSIFFVGVGANGTTGAIVTTETSSSWNDKTSEYMPSGTPVLNAVCYGSSMFVAVGESGALLVSSGVSSPPVFTSGTTASCFENSTSTGYTAAATPSNGTSVAYSLAGGVDDALFDINSSTGVLTFKSPPDYESPGDSGTNNVYNVLIRATDSAMDAEQSVAITVNNVNEAPSITSGTAVSVPENQTAAYTATANDPDSGDTITWSMTGVDADLFNINGSSGAVTFKSAPNYESPGDSDGNNVYDITVKATDQSGLWANQVVAITVTDAADPPVVSTGSASGFTATGATLSGTVNDNGGDTTVYFQYGTSTSYGTELKATTPAAGVVSSGHGNTSVGVALTTLSPGTTYHYRVKAVNSAGTIYGDDATFKTALPAPTATPGNGSTVDSGSVVTLSDATAGATIYYTTDDTDPTVIGGTRQPGTSVTVTGTPGATITVKAYAVLAGYPDSAVATFTYNIALYSAPSLTATGGTPIFYQGGSGVDLFSSVTAATNDAGQTFSGAVLTISNVSDNTEYLTIGSTDVALTIGSSGMIAGVGNYSVSVAGGTATVTLSDLSLSNSDMQTLIDGISYKNTAAAVTTGSRVVTLKTITDSGSNNNSAAVDISATVTVALQNATAPGGIVLAPGALNPVGGITNVAIPAAGETDTTGKATGWISGTAHTIKFTVTDGGLASSAISINASPYNSGTDYTITAASDLTIVVTTSESGKATVVRTFTVTVEAAGPATAPGSIVLAKGTTNPVGGVTNVAIPAAGGTDTTGKVTGWIDGTAGTITFTVTNSGSASSAITINGSPYNSGTDYTITTASDLTIVVTTSESGKTTVVRTFTVTVEAAGAASAPGSVVLAKGTTNPVDGVTNVAIPAAGGTDASGQVTGWISGTADTITFTVTNSGSASSAITINGSPYNSGTDYTITAASDLTIVVTTSESGKTTVARTFTVTVEAAGAASAPGSVVLAKGTSNPVGGVTNVAIPAAGGTDASGQVTGWISGTANTIKFTVTDGGLASSAITINGSPYNSGTDYTITAASDLTIVVTTSESGKTTVARTFTITVSSPGAPAAPANLAATEGDNLVTLNWDSVPGADGYKIYQSWITGSYGTETLSVGASVYSQDIVSLTNGATYYFVVRAFNTGGESGNSNEVNATPHSPGTIAVSDTITPSTGGTVTLNHQADIVIPAGALNGGGNATVTITTVSSPPAAPPGLTLVGAYEFMVNGGGYTFNCPITLIFQYDPSQIPSGQTPAVAYYDNTTGAWVILTGTISGNTITVAVNHLTTFAVMLIPVQQGTVDGGEGDSGYSAATARNGSGTLTPSAGGTVSLDNRASIAIPAGALKGTASAIVSIKSDASPLALPIGYNLVAAYDFTVDGGAYTFNCPVTLNFTFDPAQVPPGQIPAIYYFDASLSKWVTLEGKTSGNTITVTVDHFTVFAVLVKQQVDTSSNTELKTSFTDISNHWGREAIEKMVAQGAASGYPDGSFKPDANITRAEFITMLVQALKLPDNSNGPSFNDTVNHWAQGNIAIAAGLSITGGYKDGTFKPDDYINRQEMAVMLVKAARLTEVEENPSFSDNNNIAPWAKGSVAAVEKFKIMTGYPGNTFSPQNQATRAEAVCVIFNLVK